MITLPPHQGDLLDGRYLIEELIARGGCSYIFRARDLKTSAEVKIKMLSSPASIDSPRAIFPELSAHRIKDQSRVVPPTDTGSFRGLPYVVSLFMFGETLEARLERGALPRLEALEVCREVGRALRAVRDARLSHRDVKPANIFLCSNGEVKLFDFGLARELGEIAPAGEGTRSYMPPEQARAGIVDSRSDVFSLTCVLLTCLRGSRFSAADSNPAELIRAMRVRRPVRNLLLAGTHADIEQRPRIAEWLAVVSSLLTPWSNTRVALIAAVLAALLTALITSATYSKEFREIIAPVWSHPSIKVDALPDSNSRARPRPDPRGNHD